MTPEQLPVHQITVVGIATATNMAEVTEFGVKVECLISDYLSKDKQIELPVTLFHPTGSRFTNQTTTIKRGSSIFFSGGLILIEGELYLELHNFSFVRTTPTTKQMPWASKSSEDPISTSTNIAQSFHKLSKKSSTSVNSILTTSDKTSANITKSTHKWNKKSSNSTFPILASPTLDTIETSEKSDDTIAQNNPLPNSEQIRNKNPLTPTSTKRKTRSSYKANKMQKLSDIATNIIAVADTDPEEDE